MLQLSIALPPSSRVSRGNISRLNGDLESAPTLHLIKGQAVILKLENVSDHPFDVNLATIKIGNGTREAIRLRE